MSEDFHEIESEIRYLTNAEGGRRIGVMSGYRGQFHYEGDDQAWDGTQFFPDLPDGVMVELGIPVRALVRFVHERWEQIHSKRITIGMDFEIREGARVVGRGTVTKLEKSL